MREPWERSKCRLYDHDESLWLIMSVYCFINFIGYGREKRKENNKIRIKNIKKIKKIYIILLIFKRLWIVKELSIRK